MRAPGAVGGHPRHNGPAPPGPPKRTGPHWPAAPRLPPPPARTADGWSTCAHVPNRSGYSSHGVRHQGPAPAASSAGPPAHARGTDNTASAPTRAGDPSAQKRGGANPWGTGAPLRPQIQAACPAAHTRRLVQKGTRGLSRSRGILLHGHHRPSPGQAPCKRGTRRGATAPGKGTRRPRQPRPPDGRSWHQPHPPPPHPRPPNTATITTTPPPTI